MAENLEEELANTKAELRDAHMELENARQQLSVLDGALSRLVTSKVLTMEGRLALEARVRFDDMLLRFPLHAEGEVPSDPSWHALLTSSDTLRAMVDENTRACLCCSSLDGKNAYVEKKAREVLIAIVSLQQDNDENSSEEGAEATYSGWREKDEHMLMRLDGAEWKPFHRLNVREPSQLIASTWGIVAFSSNHSGPPGLCIVDRPWDRLQFSSFGGRGQNACCISGKIMLCGGSAVTAPHLADLLGEPGCECEWKAPEGKHPGGRPSSLSLPRSYHSCATIGGFAYAVGGLSFDGEALATIDVYDPRTDHWNLMPQSMNDARARCGIASSHGILFVFGGVRPAPEGEFEMLSTCEFLAKDSRRGWVRMPDAPAAGCCSAVAVRSQDDRGQCFIYVVFESSPLSLWQYIHRSAEWRECSLMVLPSRVTCIQALCLAPEVAHWQCVPPLAEIRPEESAEEDV